MIIYSFKASLDVKLHASLVKNYSYNFYGILMIKRKEERQKERDDGCKKNEDLAPPTNIQNLYQLSKIQN